MIAEAFYARLSGNTGITTITSAIYPQVAPQGIDPPLITYAIDADDHDPTMDGHSSLLEALFAVECYAASYRTAQLLADAVESALVGYRGDFGGLSPAVEVEHIRKERRFDLFEPDSKLHRVSLQFFVGYY